MSLRIRLLLPIFLLCCISVTYFYGFWMSRSVASGESIYRESIEGHLATIEKGLIPLMVSRQLDMVYGEFDELLKENADWRGITLFDARGKLLYPLSGKPLSQPREKGQDVRRFERIIKYRNVSLGRLIIDVDFGPRLKSIRAGHRGPRIMFLSGLFFLFLLTFLFVDRIVTRPVRVLSEAAGHLAGGDFSTVLPKSGDDEVGMLVAAFSSMREAIGRYQSELRDEIAEHRRAEEEVRASRERYRSLFMNMLEGFAYCRMLFENGEPRDFVYLDVNEAFGTLTGLKNVAGKKVSEVIPGIREANSELFEIYGRVAMTGRPEKFETYLDSLGIWFSIAVYSTEKENFIAVFDNITERKLMELALREREEMLSFSGRMAQIGGWEFDVGTGEGTWSEETARIHEVDPKAPTGVETGLSFYRGASREAIESAVREAIESARPYDLELEMVTARGTHKWIRTMGQPVREGGRVVKVRGMIQDITERKQAEEALRESGRRLKRAEEVAHLGHWRLDLGTGLVTWSDELYRIFGVAPETFRPSAGSYLEFVHPGDRESSSRVTEMIRREGTGVFEFRIIRPDGGLRHVSGYGEVVHNAAGSPTAIFGTLLDTTELRQKERELQEKNAELERFTYMISHDLKSPLVTVKTFLGYLEQDLARSDTARVGKDLNYIRTAADKMGQLLDELLEMSRIGRIESPPVRVGFGDLVGEALSLVAGRIVEKKVDVRVGDQPVILYGERPRLVEIWQNLLENAVKFMGDQASPVIEIGAEQSGGDTVFFVCDNGIGIDPRYHEKVFGLFEKLDPMSGGTGLGLALVKRIVERYRGSIRLESDGPGHGVCFRFTLPDALRHTTKGEKG